MKRLLFAPKAVAGFVAFTLCLSFPIPAVKAEADGSVLKAPGLIHPLDVSIPRELGTIKEKFEGQEGRTVFIIQDAHAVPEAQRDIQRIIELLQRQYGVPLVALEGAADDLDPLLFKAFPDQEQLHRVFEAYFERGELTGGSAAALFNEAPCLYHGIENWNLYEEGLGLFQQASNLQPEILKELSLLDEGLEQEKKKVYSQALLNADQALRNFHRNAGGVQELLEVLQDTQAPEPGSEVALLLSEMKQAASNPEALNEEVRRISETVRAKLMSLNETGETRGDFGVFNRKFQEFQNSALPPEAFALFLKELSMKYQIQMPVSEFLRQRVLSQKRMKDLEGTKLFDQIELYAQAVKKTLFRNEEEKLLDERSRRLDWMNKLARLELTRSGWLEIKAYLAKLDAWPIAQDGVGAAGDPADFIERMKANVDFYRNTEKRDSALFLNTEKLMKRYEASSAVVVAGGFHADGLTYQLKAKGISYVLMMPAIESLPEQNAYREHMRGEVSWSRYFKAENGQVNLYNAFVRGVRDDLLQAMSAQQGFLLKLWRDAVIRSLARDNRVAEAPEYTRFIDEVSPGGTNEDFVLRWRKNIENFVEGLRVLRNSQQWTEAGVASLIKPAAIPAATDLSLARSELRVDLLPAYRQRQEASGLGMEDPALNVLQNRGNKIELLVRDGIVPVIQENSRVLEMGIGSGALTKYAMGLLEKMPGVHFLGLDINQDAVNQARQTLELENPDNLFAGRVSVMQSDLFSAVSPGEKFDVIFWNPTWSSEASEGVLAAAKNDPDFAVLRRFLADARSYLAPGGKLFLILPPAAMEEIWESAEKLYDISPVPIFEQTRRRRIGLYTLTLPAGFRSELRSPSAREYEMDSGLLNQEFWRWFNADRAERKLDRGLFEKIVTGDDAVLSELLREYPEKVYVKEVYRPREGTDWKLSEAEGRTVYLRLTESFGGMDTLRLKGVRPQRDEEGRLKGYHEKGRGFVPVDVEVSGPGKLRFWEKREGYKVFGGTSEKSGRLELGILQKMKTSESLADSADKPLGLGLYRGAADESPLAFAVIGMRGPDLRVTPLLEPDDDSEDEYAKKIVFYASDYQSHQKTALSAKGAEKFSRSLGEVMRRYHDEGFYHGFPHFENFGLKPGTDLNNIRPEDFVVRDLGTTRERGIPKAGQEDGVLEMAAMYRWLDIAKSVRYFRRHENQSNRFELQLEFLKGYTGSESAARALYEPMSRFNFDVTLDYYFNEKNYADKPEKILDFDLPQNESLKVLFEKMKTFERETLSAASKKIPAVPEADDVRSARWQTEMARVDLAAAPEVLKHYDLGSIESILPTSGGVGEHGKSLLVTTDRGRFVLKPLTTALYPELEDGARFEVSVVRELIRRGWPAADLVVTTKTEISSEEDRYFVKAGNGKIYLLYHFAEGKSVALEDLTPEQLASSVHALARMHEDLKDFRAAGSRTRPSLFDFSSVTEKMKRLQSLLIEKQTRDGGAALTRAERFFLKNADFLLEQISLLNLNLPPPARERLPVMLIHGDFHPLNMTFQNDQPAGVFDWDHLRYDVRLEDFFHSIFDLKTERLQFNLDGLKHVTDLYQEVQPLTEDELKALPEMARRQMIEYLTWAVRPEKIAERHLYDLSGVQPLEQGLVLLDKNDPLFNWFSVNLQVLKDIDSKIRGGEFSRAFGRSELRTPEELVRQWNDHYLKQAGKPDSEAGHLGVQFRDVHMETGPGSIYEFDFLKEAAKTFLPDQDLGLSAEKFASKQEVERILAVLKNAGAADDARIAAVLEAFGVLEKSAGKYHADAKLSGVPNREEFLQDYYRAASLTFNAVPLWVEALARLHQSAQPAALHDVEGGFEVQTETALHFSLKKGFEHSEREQIGLPSGTDALRFFRDDPARVFAAYRRSYEFDLPLSHEIRLALFQFQPELQSWLDAERTREQPSAEFQALSEDFLALFESPQPVIDIFWEMYRLGSLEAVVPELRKVRELPSNFNIHAFTVGQHTLYNLKRLEDLRTTQDPQLQEGRRILLSLSPSEMREIRLTLLFHDLGKRMSKTPVEPDHAIVSSRDIVPVRLKELGVSERETSNVSWVVRDHMVLNAFARLHDVRFEVKLPVLLKNFARDPEASTERLKLLYLISLTDRDSVNPWASIMGPETLDRLNSIYQALEDYLKTSKEDRIRFEEDRQLEAHSKTEVEWAETKQRIQEPLRAYLSQLNAQTIRGYFKNVAIVEAGQFETVRQGLMDKAKAIAADDGAFDYLLERLLAAFSMDQIRDYTEDQTAERLLFLIHLDYQKDRGSKTPVVYFNPQFSRTYEQGYEIVIGAASDSERFFEQASGVLFRHRFDVEDADVRTLTNGEVVDTFQGFFHDEYPDERAHIALQDQITRDMQDVFLGTVPSIQALFEQAGRPYQSVRMRGPAGAQVQFLEDTDIYGVRSSVFNLKTANRLGLLHALARILNGRGINLTAAPVSTHPAMVNDTFFINQNGDVLSGEEKQALKTLMESVLSQPSIDLAGLRSELRTAPEDFEPRRYEENLGRNARNGSRVIMNRSFDGPLWIWAGRFAYKVLASLEKREFTLQRFSADKQQAAGGVYTVPFDQDYLVGRGNQAVPGQYVLSSDTDNLLSRKHFRLRVSESVWETFFTLEDTGPEGTGSTQGTKAAWTSSDTVVDKGMNFYYPSAARSLTRKVKQLGLQVSVPVKGPLFAGEYSEGYAPLSSEQLQARVIAAMSEYVDQNYGLKDYLLDRNLSALISEAFSAEEKTPRLVYHPGIGTEVSDDGQGLAVLRTLIQTDFSTLVATDPRVFSLEDFRKAISKQLWGIGENLVVRKDVKGAYLAFFDFNGSPREVIAYYGFDAASKIPDEIKKGYHVLINRRQAYLPSSWKAKAFDLMNVRKPLVLNAAMELLNPEAGFIIADGRDDVRNTETPEPGLLGLDSLQSLERLPELKRFTFLSSFEYLGVVRDNQSDSDLLHRSMPVLFARSRLAGDAYRKKIEAARQTEYLKEQYAFLSRLRGGLPYLGHGSGSLWASEAILRSGELIHKKGYIQYAFLNKSTKKNWEDVDTGGSSYDKGDGLFVLADNFEDGVDSTLSLDEDGLTVHTISLNHPKVLAVVFDSRYVPAMKRKYPGYKNKIMSFAQAADFLSARTRETGRPPRDDETKRSELRAAAGEIVSALRPDAVSESKGEVSGAAYSAASADFDGFVETLFEVFEERSADLEAAWKRQPPEARNPDSIFALRASMDLASKLLRPKGAAGSADLAALKVTMAVQFSKTEDPISFIREMIEAVSENNLQAEILSDASTHKAFSRQMKESLREFFKIKKITSADLEKGTPVSVDGLGVATAVDDAAGALKMNPMFQGLFFDFEGLNEDPDLLLSGQILFAAFLIRLAVISAESQNKPVADRAQYLKAELLRAVHEAGYLQTGAGIFKPGGGALISILGSSLMSSLVDQMKARAEISHAA